MLSVVVPSYNQAEYLGNCLDSILKNNDVEIIVIDGNSDDNSAQIIASKEDQLNYWISEEDKGQVDAINKGFDHTSGNIMSWLNSDDILCNNTSYKVLKAFEDPEVQWITGDCEFIDSAGISLGIKTPELPDSVRDWLNLLVRGKSYPIFQPSTFWRREVWEESGPLDDSLNYSFDHEFFFKIFQRFGPPTFIDETLSQFRVHKQSKTSRHQALFEKENRKIGLRNLSGLPFKDHVRLRAVSILK